MAKFVAKPVMQVLIRYSGTVFDEEQIWRQTVPSLCRFLVRFLVPIYSQQHDSKQGLNAPWTSIWLLLELHTVAVMTIQQWGCILHVTLPFHLEGLDQKDFYSACPSCVLSWDPLLSQQVQRPFMKCFEFRYRNPTVSVFNFVIDSVKYFWGTKWCLLCLPLFIHSSTTTKSWSCDNTAVTFWDKVDPSLPHDTSIKERNRNRAQSLSSASTAIGSQWVEFILPLWNSVTVMTTGKVARAISRWVTNGFLSELPLNRDTSSSSIRGWTSAAKGETVCTVLWRSTAQASVTISVLWDRMSLLLMLCWVILGNSENVGKNRSWWSVFLRYLSLTNTLL